MPTQTTNYGLNKPLVNNATDQDLWGGYLNTDLDNLDALMATAMNLIVSNKTATFSVVAPTSGSTTTGSSNILYTCDASGGAITVNLPASATCAGMVVAFKKTDSSANAVTLTGNAGELIDSANTFAISAQYGWAMLTNNGTKWLIISQSTPSTPNASTTVAGILKTSTAALALAGTDATTALTPSAFAGNNSLGASGYYEFPGGFTIQWGTIASTASTASTTTNFPIAFSTACAAVIVQNTGANTTWNVSPVTGKNTTQFTWQNNASNSQTAFYIAIGY